jgi:hypothetical protein
MRTATAAPLLLVLALALAACGDEAATAPPRDATPPVLEILAPAPADSVVFVGPVLVRARCQEDDGRGCTVSVFLQGTLVVQGTDSVNAVVSLAPHADRSVRLSFVATNLSGGRTTAETGEIRVASTPPVLEILAPTPADSVLSAAVRVRAKCTEDDARGCTVKVLLRDTLVAEGADSVNAVVSLEKHLGRTVRFVFAATNTSGGSTRAETGDFRVVGGRWTDLRLPAVPGTVRDATPDRILYIQGDHLQVRDVATGAEQGVYSESNAASTWAALFPGGVLLSYPASYGYKPTGVREVGGSGHWSGPGFSQQVRGRWAAWLTHINGEIIRDDVVARRLTIVSGVAAVVPDALDVADDGTIAYTVRPRDDFGSGEDRPRQLYLLRGDTPERIAVASGAIPLSPETDGTNVVYTRRTTTPEGVRYQLVLVAPGGEVALAPPRAARYSSQYQAEAGWVVYTLQDDAGINQVWARSPAGDARRITPWATPSTLHALGPAGQTVVENGGRWYFARTPGEALVDIGPKVQGSVRWYHGYPETYLSTGSRLLRLDF